MRVVKPTTEHLSLEQLAAIFGYELKRRPITTDEAAELRNMKSNSLEHERATGRGPRYFRDGGRVVYSERDVLEWIIAGSRRSTAENIPEHRRSRATASA